MRMKNKLLALGLMACIAPVHASDSNTRTFAEGTFRTDRPPEQKPVRVEAGESCVVDVQQSYVVDGTLSGSFAIDYRILVDGPCGLPPGTYEEEWIARGTFKGKANGQIASASFTYTAVVKAGGEVSGQMVFGQGLGGDLRIHGTLAAGKLAYEGQLTGIAAEKQ